MVVLTAKYTMDLVYIRLNLLLSVVFTALGERGGLLTVFDDT
jgi:hypothetical protein